MRPHFVPLLIGIAQIFSQISAFQAEGTSFAPKSFPQATEEAAIIVRGMINQSYVNWGNGRDGKKTIFTFTELQIIEVLKGKLEKADKNLIVREIGGEKDGVGLQVPGSAKFKPGEEVIVYLDGTSYEGAYQLRGMVMGKYNIERGANGVEILTGGRITGDPHAQSQSNSGHWTIESLRELIKSQVKEVEPQTLNVLPSQLGSTQKILLSDPTSREQPLKKISESLNTSNFEIAQKKESSRKWIVLALVGILTLVMLYFTRKNH